VHERLSAAAQLRLVERECEQANAAVDVVSDSSWGDDAVRELDGRDAADGKP
jgi:hypothetical protein